MNDLIKCNKYVLEQAVKANFEALKTTIGLFSEEMQIALAETFADKLLESFSPYFEMTRRNPVRE